MEPLLEFRNFLASHKDPKLKRKYREYKRRNGRVMMNKKTGKPVQGPYKIEYRRQWLKWLLKIEQEVRANGPDPDARLMRKDELLIIRSIWRAEESDWEDSVLQIYREVTGEDLIQYGDDSSSLTAKDRDLLSQISSKHGVPDRIVHKLLDKVRDKQGMGRRTGIYGQIESVFNEDWLTEEEVAALLASADELDEGQAE